MMYGLQYITPVSLLRFSLTYVSLCIFSPASISLLSSELNIIVMSFPRSLQRNARKTVYKILHRTDCWLMLLLLLFDVRENYLFSCECQKCTDEADDPDVTSDEEEEDSDCDHMEHS